MVTRTSAGEGAQSIQTVRGVGSSMALSSTLVVRSAIRSASSTTMIRHRRRGGPVPGGGHELAGLVDGDGDLLRADEGDVGVGFAEDGQAGRAFAAAAQADVLLVAVQGRGEGLRGVGPAGTGRAGEKPGVA